MRLGALIFRKTIKYTYVIEKFQIHLIFFVLLNFWVRLYKNQNRILLKQEDLSFDFLLVLVL